VRVADLPLFRWSRSSKHFFAPFFSIFGITTPRYLYAILTYQSTKRRWRA
jgi:hypothetical protein